MGLVDKEKLARMCLLLNSSNYYVCCPWKDDWTKFKSENYVNICWANELWIFKEEKSSSEFFCCLISTSSVVVYLTNARLFFFKNSHDQMSRLTQFKCNFYILLYSERKFCDSRLNDKTSVNIEEFAFVLTQNHNVSRLVSCHVSLYIALLSNQNKYNQNTPFDEENNGTIK